MPAWVNAETRLNGSACRNASSGALLPFSAISRTPTLAGWPTLNTWSLRRWVATTGGVSGWPEVRFVIVTSKVR
jgi:hypothetical protein